MAEDEVRSILSLVGEQLMVETRRKIEDKFETA
jgi:hypothetical protein